MPIGDENSLPDDYSEDADPNSGLFGSENVDVDATLHIPTELEYYITKAAEYYNIITIKNNVAWLPSSYFKRTLKQQLKKDCDVLIEMIKLCGDWKQETDQKLNELQRVIANGA